ncbi:SdiA-regulated domain-containing protein [Tenacibaculum pelagium]|uniref:SdiA-regulated domain-containing protein n=1 Tax=Tenacibaculum pelagium TaxID=2759527 RepID=UPI001C71661E|nr:SdiA-regulated domain-containing protein [Tenacibaculum pelagium]
MKKLLVFFSFLLIISCQNYGQLKILASLSDELKEVSGIEKTNNSDLLWMLNDGGNSPTIYKVDLNGRIIKEIAIKAKNKDWEDLTSDEEGNLYIGDFGNNNNKRKDLRILKIKHQDLLTKNKVEVEKIHFSYPSQKKFPPKKKDRFFDAESMFYKNGFIYVFTKSRVKGNYGKTSLYKIPATKGNHVAEYISEFESCSNLHCWITAAAISPNGKKVALLNHQSVLVFTDFNDDDFFSGVVKEYSFNHVSQKEGVTFKNNNTLFITDEKAHLKGGNLYEFSIK